MLCNLRFSIVHKCSLPALLYPILMLAGLSYAERDLLPATVVYTNTIQLQESVFSNGLDIGRDITGLSADISSNGISGIRVTGASGSILIDLDGKILEQTAFSSKGSHVIHFPSETGSIKYVSLGGEWQPVGVYDAGGVCLWKQWNGYIRDFKGRFIECEKAPNRLIPYAAKDGSLRFVIGYNGRGIAVLDEEGNTIKEDKNTFADSFQIYDIDHNGTPEIIYSSRTSLVIRNIDLKLLREVVYPDFIKAFLINTWPANDDKPTLFFRRGGEILIADLEGHIIKRIPSAINFTESLPLQTEWIQLDGQSAPCLVFIEAINSSPTMTGISILSAEGDLLYQETSENSVPSFYVKTPTEGLPRSFLMGKRNSISKYEIISASE